MGSKFFSKINTVAFNNDIQIQVLNTEKQITDKTPNHICPGPAAQGNLANGLEECQHLIAQGMAQLVGQVAIGAAFALMAAAAIPLLGLVLPRRPLRDDQL